VEGDPSITYPATSLQKLKYARFFITQSAASLLTLSEANIKQLYEEKKLPDNYYEKLMVAGAGKSKLSLVEASRMNDDKKQKDLPEWRIAGELSGKTFNQLCDDLNRKLAEKIQHGLKVPDNQRILHTAPHHDDIELAYFPLLHHLVRSPSNENYFVYCTSGFTSVINVYVMECLENLKYHISCRRLIDDQQVKIYSISI
jgi:glucosamine-6-phosphate deaminase